MKVCLDAGHGGSDPGAIFQRYREKDITLAVVGQLERLMKAEGERFIITLTRTHDEYVTLSERCRVANAADCEVFLSVHCNADPDDDTPGTKEASGAEVWIHPQSKRGAALGEFIHERFLEAFEGYPWRGVRKSDKLYVLKHTSMPAVLVELGFIDSRHDAEFLSRPGVQLRIARELLSALCVYEEVHVSSYKP